MRKLLFASSWKTTEICLGVPCYKLHILCGATLNLPAQWYWSLTMQSDLVLSYFPSIFFWKCDNFLDYGMILTLCLLMVSFFSFLPFLIIFIACSFKDSQNHLMQSLPLYTSYLFSTSEYSYRRHWITTWNMFPYFCFGWFFRIIYTSK